MADEFDYKAELLAIDGIGPATAVEIMEKYPTPNALADAIEKEEYEGQFVEELTEMLFDDDVAAEKAEAAAEEDAEAEAEEEGDAEDESEDEEGDAADDGGEDEEEEEKEAPKPAAKGAKRMAEVRSNFNMPIVISTKKMYARWPERGVVLVVPESCLKNKDFKEHQKRGHLSILRQIVQ